MAGGDRPAVLPSVEAAFDARLRVPYVNGREKGSRQVAMALA
jgi:hypothetical protein